MLYKWCVLCIPIGSSVEKGAPLLSLGTSTHPRGEKNLKKKRGAGTLWADLSSTQHVFDFGHRGREVHDHRKWTTESPQQISLKTSVPVSCPTTELLPLLLSQKANQLSSINQTQSTDSWLVNRSTNELGLDWYEALKHNVLFDQVISSMFQ